MNQIQKIKIHESWKAVIGDALGSSSMQELRTYLAKEIGRGKIIYPHGQDIFAAFNECPWEIVKVVIIGQDPYHGEGQAHGLSFSVRPGVKPPPSLVNIFKELRNDLGLEIPDHGSLLSWAHQGVLLLNSVLSVEKGNAGSHRKKGWEQFTDYVVEKLNEEKQGLVFILWGRDAQAKGAKIDRNRHFVIEAAHPSPFSAHKFFGHKPFSRTNHYLKEQGQEVIHWQI